MATRVEPEIVGIDSIWDRLSPSAQAEIEAAVEPPPTNTIPRAVRPGVKWTAQRLREKQVLPLIRQMRGAARHGRFVREDFDPNSPNYDPERGSNKQITIAATMVLGRPPAHYEEAWSVIAELAFG